MGLGVGTDKFVELIFLRHLLHFALDHTCNQLQIFSDSKIIINWFNNINTCYVHSLINILDEIQILKTKFNSVTYQHIFREHNSTANKLSKEATTHPRGLWLIQEQIGDEKY